MAFIGLGMLAFLGLCALVNMKIKFFTPRPHPSDVIPMLYPVSVRELQQLLLQTATPELFSFEPEAPPAPAPAPPNVNTQVSVGPVYLNTQSAPVAPLPEGSSNVFLVEGEPERLDEYVGQAGIVADMREALDEMRGRGLKALKKPHIFLGPPGVGKTLLAKVIANEINHRIHIPVQFYEELGVSIDSLQKMDAIIRRAHEHPGCILFIDEIHSLSQPIAEKLNPLLAEGRYQFEGAQLVLLNPFTLLAGTTNFGDLHPALQRRWIQHHFELVTHNQLLRIVEARGLAGTSIDPAATQLLVDRTHWSGAPWEAIELYEMAATSSFAAGQPRIRLEDVQRIIDRHEIDQYGLGRLDRRVLSAIFKCPKYKETKTGRTLTHYAVAEETLLGMTGIDRHLYRHVIRPRLASRGLYTSRQGQALTDKAIEWYGELRG